MTRLQARSPHIKPYKKRKHISHTVMQHARKRHVGVLAAGQIAVKEVIESGLGCDIPAIMSKLVIQKSVSFY